MYINKEGDEKEGENVVQVEQEQAGVASQAERRGKIAKGG